MARSSGQWADDESIDPAGRRRGRSLRWALGVLLALLVAAGGTYWRWGVNAERALNEAVDELRRNGQPVEAADLVGPPVPGADNAAIDLRSAAQSLDTASAAWKAFEAIDFDEPPTEASRRSSAAVLETDGARKALALVRQARSRRAADWQIPMQSPLISTLLPDVGEQRKLARLVRAAAEQARLRGDCAAAVEYHRDILGISRAVDRQGLLITHLVALTISGMAVKEIEELAPQLRISEGVASADGPRPATPDQVRMLIAGLLDESPANEGLRRGFRTERVLQLDTALLLADRKLSLSAVMGTTGAGKGAAIDHLPRAMILSDARLMLENATATLAALEKSPDWPTYQKSAPPSPLPEGGGTNRHFVASLLLPTYENAVRNHFHGLGDRRLAAATLGVRWYASDHGGKPPQTLAELFPIYLSSIPIDPMVAGGKPLRYLPAPHALLYSVGDNGTDESGSEAPLKAHKQPVSRWDQEDAVFSPDAKDR